MRQCYQRSGQVEKPGRGALEGLGCVQQLEDGLAGGDTKLAEGDIKISWGQLRWTLMLLDCRRAEDSCRVSYAVQFTLTDTVVQTQIHFMIPLFPSCRGIHVYILINISMSPWLPVDSQQYGTQPDKFVMTERQRKLALVHSHHLAFGLVCFAITLRAGRQRELWVEKPQCSNM